MAAPLVSDIVTLPSICLHLTNYLPPSALVILTYKRLKAQAKQHLLIDWGSVPAHEYYLYPPAVCPHPFMGLGKFIAGRIHQMRSGKSYLVVYTLWENPDRDRTCPNCSVAPQSFENAIVLCPLSAWQRSCLLLGVSDLG